MERGYFTVQADMIFSETEKAVKVLLATGTTVGSGKGWTCWIPKSLIA